MNRKIERRARAAGDVIGQICQRDDKQQFSKRQPESGIGAQFKLLICLLGVIEWSHLHGRLRAVVTQPLQIGSEK
jgi:hypothetical protein